jgi:acetyl-CoA carboxylase biotin carboxyl carrier protein
MMLDDPRDMDEVAALLDLMRDEGIVELNLELPDFKIHLKRGEEPAAVEPAAPAATPAAPESAAAPVALPEAAPTLVVVTAPWVGVFHLGGDPTPLAAGDAVSEGQALGAIESMKVPNDLRSPVSGLLVRVLVDGGAGVEFGQPLFEIAPDMETEEEDEYAETEVGAGLRHPD